MTEASTSVLPHVILLVCDCLCTAVNLFSIWKEYLHCPLYDPDAFVSSEDLLAYPQPSLPNAFPPEDLPLHAHDNRMIALLMDWQNSGSSAKSEVELNHLVHNIVHHPSFNTNALNGFNAQ